MLMLAGGCRSLEDLRTLKRNTALATVRKQQAVPSTDVFGDSRSFPAGRAWNQDMIAVQSFLG